jgi:hypothetical protein
MENDETTPEVEQDENKINEEVSEEKDTSEQSGSKEVTQDDKDWKAEALKYKAILDRNKNKTPETKTSKKSDDLDYGQKAFLVANGVKGAAEIKLAKDFMANTGKSLEEIMENKYFQAELTDLRELEATTNATPKGGRSPGVQTDSVEYWAAKPIEEVPKEMRIKVVNFKLKKENATGAFYNS